MDTVDNVKRSADLIVKNCSLMMREALFGLMSRESKFETKDKLFEYNERSLLAIGENRDELVNVERE